MVDIVRPEYGQGWASQGERVAPAEAKMELGWVQEMMPFQWENYLQGRQDDALLYLLQKGVPEYSPTQEYIANKSVVQYQTNLYLALATVTNVLPTVTASWKRLSPTLATNGTVPITSGGTGGTTAAEARANLGLGDASTVNLPTTVGVVVKDTANTLVSRTIIGVAGDVTVTNPDGVAGNITVGVGSNVAKTNQDSSWTSKGGIKLPAGSTAERGVATAGKLRFNNTTGVFEGYNGTTWEDIGRGTVSSSDITDATTVGRSVLTANTAAAARTTIGAEQALVAGTTTQYYRGDKTWQTLNKATVGLDNVDNTADSAKPVSTAQQTALNSKVDKVAGKQLSTEDYTSAEKTKLASVEEGANAYTHPDNHPASIIAQDADNRFVTDDEKTTWNAKQAALVSGTNIKTINGESLLGGGDLVVVGGGGIPDAPTDGKTYGRENAAWVEVPDSIKNAILSYPDYASASDAAATLPDGQIVESPNADGNLRKYVISGNALVDVGAAETYLSGETLTVLPSWDEVPQVLGKGTTAGVNAQAQALSNRSDYLLKKVTLSSTISPSLGYKKKLIANIPFKYPRFSTHSVVFKQYNCFPQGFTFEPENNYIYIAINSNDLFTVAVWDVSDNHAPSFVTIFKIDGVTSTQEGLGVRWEDGVRKLYFRDNQNSLNYLDITTLPAEGTVVITAPTSVGIPTARNYAIFGDDILASSPSWSIGAVLDRYSYGIYDKDYKIKGTVTLRDAGVTEAAPYAGILSKIQGVSKINGGYVGALGGGAGDLLYKSVGTILWDESGNVLSKTAVDQQAIRDYVSNVLGATPHYCESEGIYSDPTGRVYTLVLYINEKNQSGSEDGGILIFEEFSSDPDAIDFSSSALILPTNSYRGGLYPITRIYDSITGEYTAAYYNPFTKTAFTDWYEICGYMIALGISEFRYYADSPAVVKPTDMLGNVVPVNYGLITISNCNNTNFIAECVGSDTTRTFFLNYSAKTQTKVDGGQLTPAVNGGVSISGGEIGVLFGTSSNSVCRGDDSRLSNARPASDVYSWAKTSSKPSYTASEVRFNLGTVADELLSLKESKVNSSQFYAAIGSVGSGAPIPYLGTLASLNANPSADKTKFYVIQDVSDAANYGYKVYWNGSAWVSGGVYQNSILTPGSVNSQNLSNALATHIVSTDPGTWKGVSHQANYWNTSTGLLQISNNFLSTLDVVPVVSGETYVLDFSVNTGVINRVDMVWYDSNMAFISTSVGRSIDIAPVGAAFVRFNFRFTASTALGALNRWRLSSRDGMLSYRLNYEIAKPAAPTMIWYPGYVTSASHGSGPGLLRIGDSGSSGYVYGYVRLKAGDAAIIKYIPANNISAVTESTPTGNTPVIYDLAGGFKDTVYVASTDVTLIISSATDTGMPTPGVEVVRSFMTDKNTAFPVLNISANAGYVSTSGVLTGSSVYSSSNLIPIRKGEVLRVTASGSASVSVITKYLPNGSFESTKILGGSTQAKFFSYVPTEDYELIRVSSRNDGFTPEISIIKPGKMTGKTFAMLGDSYVRGNTTNQNLVSYNQVAVRQGAVFSNFGQNGNTISAIQADGMVNRYTTMPLGFDYVGIQGGRNDFNKNVPIGTNASTDPNTFKGALNVLCAGLIARYPNAKLFGVNCWNVSDAQNEYAKAFIEIVSGVWSIPTFDAMSKSGVYMRSSNFRALYCEAPNDVSHLNEAGHTLFADKLETFLLSI